MNKSKFIIGIILCLTAAALFIFFSDDTTIAPPVTIGILGIILIATSKTKK